MRLANALPEHVREAELLVLRKGEKGVQLLCEHFCIAFGEVKSLFDHVAHIEARGERQAAISDCRENSLVEHAGRRGVYKNFMCAVLLVGILLWDGLQKLCIGIYSKLGRAREKLVKVPPTFQRRTPHNSRRIRHVVFSEIAKGVDNNMNIF